MVTVTGSPAMFANAIEKAIKVAPYMRYEDGHWLVEGSRGMYTIVLTAGEPGSLVCDCTAGGLGNPCYHAAAVALKTGRVYYF